MDRPAEVETFADVFGQSMKRTMDKVIEERCQFLLEWVGLIGKLVGAPPPTDEDRQRAIDWLEERGIDEA